MSGAACSWHDDTGCSRIEAAIAPLRFANNIVRMWLSARVWLPAAARGLIRLALFCWTLAGAGWPVAQAQQPVEPISGHLAAADVASGETLFLQCAACHVATPGAAATIGPNLWNVVGRAVASEPGFDYSESLQQLGGQWDFERLNVYLYDPKLLAPQGRMPFPGIKSTAERAHLIAYLRTLSDDPQPLPPGSPEVTASSLDSAEDDARKWQGLPPGPGREDVFYRCKACHSLMIVKQQGLSRAAWDESLVWMVEEQGMPPIEDAATRNRVLDYLSTHFGRN